MFLNSADGSFISAKVLPYSGQSSNMFDNYVRGLLVSSPSPTRSAYVINGYYNPSTTFAGVKVTAFPIAQSGLSNQTTWSMVTKSASTNTKPFGLVFPENDQSVISFHCDGNSHYAQWFSALTGTQLFFHSFSFAAGNFNFHFRSLINNRVLLVCAGPQGENKFGVAIMSATNGNLINNFQFEELTPYSATLLVQAVYIIDENNFKAIAYDYKTDVIIMIMDTLNGVITYKRVMINLSSLAYLRSARFLSETEYLVPGNGKQLLTNYKTMREWQYASNSP